MRRFFATCVLLLFVMGARPAVAVLIPAGALSLSSATTIPFTLSGNHIFIRATVDAAPGTVARLVLERNGLRFTKSLTLRDLI